MKHLLKLILILSMTQSVHSESLPVFFGTTAGGNSGSEGIYLTTLDTESGSLARPARLAAKLISPGFLARHPHLPVLYSIGIIPNSKGSLVASYSINQSGKEPSLEKMNSLPTGCGGSAHLGVDPSGNLLVTAQYGEGSLAVFSLNSDGSIEALSQTIQLEGASNAHKNRQEAPHPHNVTFSPGGNFALVPDLGADATYIFQVDHDASTLTLHGKATSSPAAGPRHMTFSPNGHFAYVLNELTLTVDVFAWDEQAGSLTYISSNATLSESVKRRELVNSASEIRIHSNGKFLYTANRGNDSISCFKVSPQNGSISLLDVIPVHAAWPRNFNIDPSGKWLLAAGKSSHNVGVFAINPHSGLLTYKPHSSIHVPAPICVQF